MEMVFWSFTFQNLSEVDTFQNETEVKSSLFVVRHGINRLLSESKAKVWQSDHSGNATVSMSWSNFYPFVFFCCQHIDDDDDGDDIYIMMKCVSRFCLFCLPPFQADDIYIHNCGAKPALSTAPAISPLPKPEQLTFDYKPLYFKNIIMMKIVQMMNDWELPIYIYIAS